MKTFYLPAKSTKLILLTVSQGMSWSNFAYSLSTNKQKKTIFIDLLFILNLLVILWRRYKDINLNGPTKFLEVIPVFLLLLRCLSITSWSSQFVQVFQEVYCYLYRLKEEIRKTLQTWSISPKERALNEHSEGSRMAIWFSEDASHVVRFCVKKKKKQNWSYWLVWNWL